MKIRNLILLAFGLLPFFAASQTATFDRVRVRQGLTIRSEKADSIIRAVTALSNHTSIPTAKAVWDAIAATVTVATVADSTAFRAYAGGADVVIMTEKDRGGKFRKCTSCTADQYMVFADATAQKWERYDYGGYLFPEWFGSGNGSANATLGIRRTIRYAENSGERVMFRFRYSLTDSVHIRKKVHIEGANHANQSGTKSSIDFDLPDNRPAFWVNPTSQSMQGPTIRDLAFHDVSASGNRHCFEMFAEIADQKFLSTFFAENLAFVGWKRYPFYFNDLYTAGLSINMVNATSCGGIVGVDMSGTKLVTQSQGDTWTISNIVTGGTIPELVSGDTAMVDVRDVGNVMLENITLQGSVGTGISKQLIWADFGCVDIVEIYCELAGTGGLSNWGRFGHIDNPDCDVNIRGLYFSVGEASASHTFDVFGPAKVHADYVEYGVGSPSTLFTRRGTGASNISIENFIQSGRLPRVDAFAYDFPLTMQGTNDYREMRYPAGGILWQMGKDTLFGPTGFGNIVGGTGVFTQDIDADKGKVFKLNTVGDRLYFVWNLALPLELRGKNVSISMTYKFVTSDSTGGDVNRWAIYSPIGSNYLSMAQLQLNRWAVATDVFEYPIGSSSVELTFGDVNAKFLDDDSEMWISDITLSYGQQLKGEAYDKPAKNDIIFRKNISGANVSAFNNGDLVSTEQGLYIKRDGAWSIFSETQNDVLGSGAAGQVTFWDGVKTIAGENEFWWDKTNNRLGLGTVNPRAKAHIIGNGVGIYEAGASSSGGRLFLGDLNFDDPTFYERAPGLGAVFNTSNGVAGDLGLFAYNSGQRYMRAVLTGPGNFLVGSTTGDRVEIMPGTSEISLFNVGTIDARIWANDFGKLETNVGLEAVGNSAITGNLNVTGSITTSGHFLAPGISSAPFGSGVTTAIGTVNAWSPTGTSPYVTFSENGIANRGAFGFPASSGDFLWTVGNQVLSSGTEKMRLGSTGLKVTGTGNSPSLLLNNTTASTGKEWYLNSGNAGSLFIGNPTTADVITIDGTTGATTIQPPLTLSTTSGTAASLLGLTAGNVVAGVTLGPGLSLSGGTLSATGGGTNYQTLRDDGTDMTQRAAANYVSTSTVSMALTDDAGGETEIRATIPTGGVGETELAPTGVTAATYTNATVTVDVDGRVISAANGTPTVVTATSLTADADNLSASGGINVLRVSGDNGIRAITSISATGMPDGQTFRIVNTGTQPLVLQAQHPDATAGNEFLSPKDVFLPAGQTVSAVRDGTAGGFWLDDAQSQSGRMLTSTSVAGSATAADWGTLTQSANSGAIANGAVDANGHYFWSLATQAVATAAPTISVGKGSAPARTGDCYLYHRSMVRIPTLSDASNTFEVVSGFSTNTTPTGGSSNSARIAYKHDTNGGRWYGYTSDNSTANTVDLGITVATNTVYILEVYLNKQSTEARFFVNGEYRGRSTTNTPSTGAVAWPQVAIIKSVGTTARSLYLSEISATYLYPN